MTLLRWAAGPFQLLSRQRVKRMDHMKEITIARTSGCSATRLPSFAHPEPR